MRINKLHIENFRGYKNLDLSLHKGFNLIIGDNGSGKTAILEALNIAMGSFFLGIRNTKTRNILHNDVHISSSEFSEEFAWPVSVKAEGVFNDEPLIWKRELTSFKSSTLIRDAKGIKDKATELDAQVRKGEAVDLPILAYYATGRLFNEAKASNVLNKKIQIGSRFRAYDKCLEAKSTFKQFLNWYKSKELSKIQKGESDLSYSIVKDTIVHNIPNCKNIYFEFDEDKPQGLKIEMNDGRTLPFLYLSDGVRNFFALIADIAYKCVILNSHLKEKVLEKTKGIVLIDELDLHLHPDWQKKIVLSLRNTFPSIQFVASTHSPFLIQEAEYLIKLKDNAIESLTSAVDMSIEDIAEEIQEVVNPQWSEKRQKMFSLAKEYYRALKAGEDVKLLKIELNKAMIPFSQNTAFHAIIEQKRLSDESNQMNNETNR
jgi:predicted ATP-binding protein involved in virulence